jgi:DNA-binding response OmpR family regulator
MSADQVAILEERVRQLRAELGVEPERIKVDRLQVALHLTRSLALILAALHDAGSSWLTAERLDMVLPDRDARDLKTIKVHICRLRQILGSDSIICMSGAGYTLGAPGVLACKRALA